MHAPGFVGRRLVRPAVGFDGRRVRLLIDAYQILVQTVEEDSQVLLRIVLVIIRELGGMGEV